MTAQFNGQCAFCGEIVAVSVSTSHVNHLCVACHKINIAESRAAIMEIQSLQGTTKTARRGQKEQGDVMLELAGALDALRRGPAA